MMNEYDWLDVNRAVITLRVKSNCGLSTEYLYCLVSFYFGFEGLVSLIRMITSLQDIFGCSSCVQ